MTKEQVLEERARAELCAAGTLPGERLRSILDLALRSFDLSDALAEAESYLRSVARSHPPDCQYCEMSSKPGPHPDCQYAIDALALLRRIAGHHA